MVEILDTTLREGEQTPYVNFLVDEKVEIARCLDQIGVEMIEAGDPSVSPNLAAAMLVGGLGGVFSGNIGEQAAVFEPVHGSAPNLVGTGKANPAAAILSAAMMLNHLGQATHGGQVRDAVSTAIAAGEVTEDLGGSLSTQEMTHQIIEYLEI